MKTFPSLEEAREAVKVAISDKRTEIASERYVRETLKRLRAKYKSQFENLFLKERAK